MAKCRICKSETEQGYRRDGKPWKSSDTPFVFVCDGCKPFACRKFNKKRGKTGRIVKVPSFDQWLSVLEKAWDSDARCFRCQISGVKLSTDKRSVYPTLEHADNGKFMVVAFVINDMKSDLTLNEFQKVVAALARRFEVEADVDLQSVLMNLRDFRRH